MEIFAILIGLVILAAMAFYVSRPLVAARRAARPDSVDALTLEVQRESLYTQIKELDLDHATGKVNEEDYVPLRAALVAQAAAVLKQIDGVTRAPAVESAVPDKDVEAMIAARRKTRLASAPKPAEADLEAAITARRKTASPVSHELKCPQCGRPINADDAFCAKCGAALQTQATP